MTTEERALSTEAVQQKKRRILGVGKGNGRGFASMSPEKKREIASMGSLSALAMGTAHTWTSEEAQRAGRIGGAKSRRGPKMTYTST